MSNDIIIDGRNITQEFGARLLKGSIASIIAYPPIKPSSISVNDWHEHDGEEADLHDPHLSSREMSISIFLKNGEDDYVSISQMLMESVYHEFEFKSIGRTLRLRVNDISDVTKICNSAFFNITLSKDDPWQGYTYLEPTKGFTFSSSLKMDERNMADYGVRVLKGTAESFMKYGKIRSNMSRDISTMDGTIYGGNRVSLSAKDVTLSLLMVAEDKEAFMRNWEALLYDLSRPYERSIAFGNMGLFNSYYKSCSVSEFVDNGTKVWCKFSVTLRCIGDEYGFFVDSLGNLQCIVPSTKQIPSINVNVNSAFDVIMITDGEADNLLFGIDEGNLILSK